MTEYNPDIHHRRSIRLKNYDYSQSGLYFITICTQNMECLFGEIGLPGGNEYGHIVKNTWFDLVNHISNIKLHEFIVMPNHIHGIIEIIVVGAGSKPALSNPALYDNKKDVRAGLEPAPTDININMDKKSISEIMRQFKTFSAKRINKLRNTPGISIWQRNYYEHIIRNEESYYKISEYIINNPMKWQDDKYFA